MNQVLLASLAVCALACGDDAVPVSDSGLDAYWETGGEAALPDAGQDVAKMDAAFDAEPDAHPDSLADAKDDAIAALRANVSQQAEALVDPSGQDATRAVGAIVVLVSSPHSEVLGFGALHAGGVTAPDGTTVFQIGSVTKALTGLMLAARVQLGLSPDAPVNDLLASDVQAPSFGLESITVEHLTSHYGAMPAELPDNKTGPSWSPVQDYTREQLATYLAGYTLPYAPGTHYVYSNTGTGLLGLALADSAGQPDYHGLLLSELAGPLGMVDTGTLDPAFLAGLGNRVAQGYRASGGTLSEVGLADMGVLAGGGEVVSTGNDFVRLLNVLTGLQAHPVDGTVERAIFSVGAAENGNQVGYGFNILTGPEGPMYEKAGVVVGYSTELLFMREPAVGVVVMANRGGFNAISVVARDALRALHALVREP